MATIAGRAEAAFVRIGMTAVAGEGEAAQFAGNVALRAARFRMLSGERKAGAIVIEIRDRTE